MTLQQSNEFLVGPIESVTYGENRVENPDEELKHWIGDQGWTCRTWTDSPGTKHAPHDHPYSHRVLGVTGWIEFTVRDETYRLSCGDTLDLPERVEHSAVTSPEEPTEYWLLQPQS